LIKFNCGNNQKPESWIAVCFGAISISISIHWEYKPLQQSNNKVDSRGWVVSFSGKYLGIIHCSEISKLISPTV
jgi:formate hydrogenlyase subunit 4